MTALLCGRHQASLGGTAKSITVKSILLSSCILCIRIQYIRLYIVGIYIYFFYRIGFQASSRTSPSPHQQLQHRVRLRCLTPKPTDTGRSRGTSALSCRHAAPTSKRSHKTVGVAPPLSPSTALLCCLFVVHNGLCITFQYHVQVNHCSLFSHYSRPDQGHRWPAGHTTRQ